MPQTLKSEFRFEVEDFERLTSDINIPNQAALMDVVKSSLRVACAKQEKEAIEKWCKEKGVDMMELLDSIRPVTILEAATANGLPVINMITSPEPW